MGDQTGKVFSGSTDVYQDQAQVLFDYYRQAAEKIVAEEAAIEQQIAEVDKRISEMNAQLAGMKTKLIIWGVVAGVSLIGTFVIIPVLIVGVVVGGIMAARSFMSMNETEKSVTQFGQRKTELGAAWQAVRRDYRIERIGVAYVPVAKRVQQGNQSYVVDVTGDQPDMEFSLTLINQPDELKETMDGLHEHMLEMPTVETNEEPEQVDTSDYSTSVQDITLHDYMGAIDRQVRTVRYLIDDSRRVSMSMPVVPPASTRYNVIEEYGTSNPSNYPVIPIFDERAVDQKVSEFSSMGALNQQSNADGSANVEFFVGVMRQLAQGVDMLSKSRTASMTQLIGYSSHVFQTVLKAAYDQYSPALEAEEIERIRSATFNYADEVEEYRPFSLKESSRVRYDLFSGMWIADNGSRTNMPFGMHQVDAEVLMPVIDNLMQENRVERLRIYSDIQNQKIDYLNQWHRDTDDFFGRNRTEANGLIQRMNETFAEFTESYTNYEQQSASFARMKATGNIADAEVEEAKNQEELIAGFALRAQNAHATQEEFTQFMERIRDDIDASAERFGHVEYYEASLRDSQARANAQAIDAVRELDARRQQLAGVSAYLAQNGFVPPQPDVSEELDQDFAINLTGQVEGEVNAMRGNGRVNVSATGTGV